MEYKAFMDQVQTLLEQRLGNGVTLSILKVPKNNGQMLDGLATHFPGEALAPTIYLNPYYEQYLEGMSMNEVVHDIQSVISGNPSPISVGAEQISRVSFVRDRIMFKLIHASSNAILLEDIPHILYLDLAIVFYLWIDCNANGRATALVHKEHQKLWNFTESELFELAQENTPRILPAEFKSMIEVMKEMAKEALGDECNEEMIEALLGGEEPPAPLYVLTNSTKLDGASCILYPGMLESLSNFLDSDLIVLPSSVHEVLVTPHTEEVSYVDFGEMVTHINQHEVNGSIIKSSLYL